VTPANDSAMMDDLRCCVVDPTQCGGTAIVNTTNGTAGPMINRRIDPARDRRRLVLFFAGLVVFYVGVLLVTQPKLGGGEAELNKAAFGVMLAPTVGAILACVFGPSLIRFGMPSWWLLASFLPAVLVFLITMIAAPASDAVTFHSDQVLTLLLMAVVQSLLGCIPALGEEIGWRGFLWPLMRRRLTFLVSTAIMSGSGGSIMPGSPSLDGTGSTVESRRSRWACSVSCCSSACSPSARGRSGRACWPTAPGMGWSSRTSPHPVLCRIGFSPGAGICSVSSAGWGRWAC
jgi:hypothetical protein